MKAERYWPERAHSYRDRERQAAVLPGSEARRLAAGAVALVIAAGLVTTGCNAAMSWDGSHLFFMLVDRQQLALPHERMSDVIFQYPALLAIRHTGSLSLAALLYNLMYASVPVVSLTTAWRVVRRDHARLFIWPLFGVCIATLAGHFFIVSECTIALHIAWAPFLAIVLGRMRRHWLIVLISTSVIFFLHPVALALFALGFVTVTVWRRGGSWRARVWVAAACVALFALRLTCAAHNDYERSLFTLRPLLSWFMIRLPVTGYILTSAVMVLLLTIHDEQWARHRALRRGSFVALGLAAASFLLWAANVTKWQYEIGFRYFAPVFEAPVYWAAVRDCRREDPRACRPLVVRHRLRLGLTMAAIFALTLGIQSIKWQRLGVALRGSIASSALDCIPMDSLAVIRGTPLTWWTTSSYSILLQGRAPAKLVLDGNGCASPTLTTQVPLPNVSQRSRNHGWFELERVGLPSLHAPVGAIQSSSEQDARFTSRSIRSLRPRLPRASGVSPVSVWHGSAGGDQSGISKGQKPRRRSYVVQPGADGDSGSAPCRPYE